ncbi:ribosomal large subunit pseudouridine synthase D [Candidatus Mycoplasma haematohominis]|uniref:Pseudouridine synthase n=1 Tax=Candidatus Mycoplasma haematohominis TaxID=1494318 RepID=A0A478FTD5_9MOLU|nr:ribosomal large subunit pseudouridine synthase D [Candidatus Mycoplasma haemohominis]
MLKKIFKKISEKYDNYLLLKYLKIVQPNWTKVFAIKMIRTKNVLVNNKKTEINYKLKTGDVVEFYGVSNPEIPNEKKLNLSKLRPLQIIYEDEKVIIVSKEIGIPVQADKHNNLNNMNNRLLNHLNWKNKDAEEQWKPTFIHRLDRNTSGLLIGAKTYKAYLELNTAMKVGKIEKYYTTIVSGLIPFKTKIIKNYLLKLPEENRVQVVEETTKGAKQAISEVKLIKHLISENNSLLEVKLITGRTHQIRVHLWNLGYPIRGDQKYGQEKDKKKYPYPVLTAYKLIFSDSLEGENIQQLKNKTFELRNIRS